VQFFIIFVAVSVFTCSLSMQHTSLSPDRKVVVIVGDDPDGLLIDANSGKVPSLINMVY
jgi:hypothetical protein